MIRAAVLLLLTTTFAYAALNGPCTVGSTPGICITTTSCSASGGTSHSGFCPYDPYNVRCCTKNCGSGGVCRFRNTCTSGRLQSGLCPGPDDFLCCLPPLDGGGGGGCLRAAAGDDDITDLTGRDFC